MAPAKVAEIIAKYRNAATLAIAGAVALVMTMGTQRGPVVLGVGRAMKYFVFVFVAVAVLVAVAFTVALVIAETKAEAAKREADQPLPKATAMPRSVPARPTVRPSRSIEVDAARSDAPRAETPQQPDRAVGDGPTFLR
jgi:hypothetical protein